jgi:hypothetical protein
MSSVLDFSRFRVDLGGWAGRAAPLPAVGDKSKLRRGSQITVRYTSGAETGNCTYEEYSLDLG